jgi:antitoxin CptB
MATHAADHLDIAELSAREIARLRWRCRRGMRELDVLLTRYLERTYRGTSPGERAVFEQLLELPDPELFGYLVGRTQPGEAIQGEIVARIRREQP